MKCIIAAPNLFLYPWESDLIIVNKSGYISEYEVKLSVSDFRNDFKKQGHIKSHTNFYGEYLNGNTKHESLVKGFGPNRFFYCFPADMIPHSEVPEWAGIIHIRSFNHNNIHFLTTSIIRNPKRLHSNKATKDQIDKINTALYYKVFNRMK